MIRVLQIIYDNLHFSPDKIAAVEIRSDKAIKFLSDRYSAELDQFDKIIYKELLLKINSLGVKNVPIGFIERFCFGKLSDKILSIYPVNIAEAYVISCIVINGPMNIHTVYYKLGGSGLLQHTSIKGVMITDTEAVAQFVMQSLCNANLIKITETNQDIIVGKDLALNELNG